ncbi:hypothetical protein KM176_03315 [Pseudooceanicola sp. CBS1P-1]|uniref:Uncharacterized protein n=1 Tax=Pseudooceanicola albus TaxID=2692189 RepID=A0A6L7G834_9RHOB|nr:MULTISPECIES: hypothetical protein [Pseudooceanicola]MBT9382881.1 hypothetical protein [Pseudooceanicola endophyticus]MXN20195.1 hypothetical protein [Pseudooceanicola albus]
MARIIGGRDTSHSPAIAALRGDPAGFVSAARTKASPDRIARTSPCTPKKTAPVTGAFTPERHAVPHGGTPKDFPTTCKVAPPCTGPISKRVGKDSGA